MAKNFMKDALIPDVVVKLVEKHLMYGNHCVGCKYYFRDPSQFPCKVCELVSKPSQYVSTNLERGKRNDIS